MVSQNSKSCSPYKYSQKFNNPYQAQLDAAGRRTFIIKKGNLLPPVSINKQHVNFRKKGTQDRLTSAESQSDKDYVDTNQNGRDIAQSKDIYNDLEINSDSCQIEHTPTFNNKQRKITQNIAKLPFKKTDNQGKDALRSSLTYFNQSKNQQHLKLVQNNNKKDGVINGPFQPYQNNNLNQIEFDNNSLERKERFRSKAQKVRSTVYGVPFLDQEKVQNENHSINYLKRNRKSNIANQRKLNNQQELCQNNNGMKLSNDDIQSKGQNINRPATSSVNNQFSDYRDPESMFPQARANGSKSKQQRDYCKVKINREPKVLNHLKKDHQENMSLLFYDFNNTNDQDNNQKARSQSRDRLPSRGVRSREYAGSQRQQRIEQQFNNIKKLQSNMTQGQNCFIGNNQVFNNGRQMMMEAIREEEAYQ